MPDAAGPALEMLAGQLRDTQGSVRGGYRADRIGEMQREDALVRRLATVPGVDTISSSALAATPPTLLLFVARVVARHGSPCRRGPISVAGKKGSGGSPRQAIDTCEGCSTSAQWPRSARGEAQREIASDQALDWLDWMLVPAREGARNRVGQPHGTDDPGRDCPGQQLPNRTGPGPAGEMARRRVR